MGLVSLGVSLNAAGEVTEQFFAGPFPLYVSIAASGSLGLSWAYQASLAESEMKVGGVPVQSFSKMPGQNSISLIITVSFTLSLGVGLKGFASAGFSGGIAMQNVTSWTFAEHPDSQHPEPHDIFSLTINTTFFAQALFFKWTIPIYSWNWPCLASNWYGEENHTPEGHLNQLADGHDRLAVEKSMSAFANASDRDSLLKGFALGSAGAFTWLCNNAALVSAQDLKGCCESEWNRPAITSPEDALAQALPLKLGYNKNFFNDNFNVATALQASSTNDSNWVNDQHIRMIQLLKPAEGSCSVTATSRNGVGLAAQDSTEHVGETMVIDNVCFTNVYSDDRMKVVQTSDSSYMFRIASVSVNGKTRPRLYAAKYDKTANKWVPSTTQPDFEAPSGWGITRDSLVDYDFDVCPSGDGTEILVLLVSGYRANPDGETSANEAVQSNIYTCMRLDASTLSVKYVSPQLANYIPTADSASFANENETNTGAFFAAKTYHNLSCPKIIPIFVNSNEYLFAYYTFLHRTADDPAKLLSDTATCSVVCGVVKSDESGSALVAHAQSVSAGAFDIRVAQAPSSNASSRAWATDILVFYSDSSKPDALGKADFIRAKASDSTLSFSTLSTGNSFADIPQTWHTHSGFLAREDKHLQWISTPDVIDSGQKINRVPVDNNGFDSSTFAVDTAGNYVYFINSYDAPAGYAYGQDGYQEGNVLAKDDTPALANKKEYAIYAAKSFLDSTNSAGVSFCRPFLLATTQNPIDTLVSVANQGEETVFFYNEVTSANNSQSNLHCLRVPHRLDSKVTAVASKRAYVMAGAGVISGTDPEDFYITVENTGTTGITGFVAQLYDDTTKKIINEFELKSFNADNMVLNVSDMTGSNANPEDGKAVPAENINPNQNGGAASFSDSKRDGLLMPGENATFKASFNIPEDWEGEHSVYVKISKMDMDREGIMLLSEDASGPRFTEPLTVMLDNGTLKDEHILTYDRSFDELEPGTIQVSNATLQNNVNQQLVSVVGEEPIPGPNSDPSNTSRTGDYTSAFGLAALTAGAIGAGMLAYSKRRTENESRDE